MRGRRLPATVAVPEQEGAHLLFEGCGRYTLLVLFMNWKGAIRRKEENVTTIFQFGCKCCSEHTQCGATGARATGRAVTGGVVDLHGNALHLARPRTMRARSRLVR